MDRGKVYIRPMVVSDVEQIKKLHDACLPLSYDESYYEGMAQDPDNHFCTVAALKSTRTESDETHGDESTARLASEEIIGAVTAQYWDNESARNANGVAGETYAKKQDTGGLIIRGGSLLLYVSSLVVAPQHRRKGIASHLLERCVEDALRRYVTFHESVCAPAAACFVFHHPLRLHYFRPQCAAIVLHVVARNKSAISLYRSQRFVRMKRLRRFYKYDGQHRDAYLFVRCLNSGFVRRRRCAIM